MRPSEVPDQLRDFRNFLWLTWRHLGLPEPTPVQYLIADYLQHGPRRGVIEAFRGIGKSWITSAFVCWRLLLNPQRRLLVVSASKARADDFVIFTRRLIAEFPLLQHLQPKSDRSTRDSRVSFDVGPAEAAHAPSVKSLGITSQIAGSRADDVIADDIEVPNNSATETMREKLHVSVAEFDSVITPGGTVRFLGTPQTWESTYMMLQERGYEVRAWPARYPNPEELISLEKILCPTLAKQLRADPTLAGQPTDPLRFDDDDLIERALSNGRMGWQLQFMLNCSLSDQDRFPLKLKDLVVTDLDDEHGPEKVLHTTDPEKAWKELPNVGFTGDRYYRPWLIEGTAPYQGSLLSIDPAGRGADETSWVITKILNGYIFLVAWGGFSSGYAAATLQGLADLAKKHKVNYCEIEANFGDGMFMELLKPYLMKTHPVTCEEVRHSIQKEKRIIDTLEPVMAQHKLVVDKSVVVLDRKVDSKLSPEECLKYEGFRQLTHITRDRGSLRHDDRIDVLAMAVSYWVQHMGKDADQEVQARKNDKIDEALREFVDSFNSLGGDKGKQSRVWVSGAPKMSIGNRR